ncbi:MAG: phosphate ABC transporter substrate-binding protein PstS [Acidocella sp. 20-57-95]|nr:MAG: phosphate ABC transporter substrate-binding protein PstS [Acidocella sp. 20-57-95]
MRSPQPSLKRGLHVHIFKNLRRSTLLRSGVAALALAAVSAGTAQAATTLVETGSSLLYPLFNIWVPDFTAANPGIQVTTTSTGSGAGIAQSMKGLVQIGASDAYLSDSIVAKNPNMLSIPLAISAQSVNYNLPGMAGKHLRLSGPVLADIYMGKITMWNDPKIKAINPGVTLPAHVIIPIHRVDGSGDTFIFSQYLDKSTPAWHTALGFGTTISWPAVQGGLGANGNPGMVSAAASNPYSIAYIGVSFKAQIDKAGLGTAELKNADGKYVLPTNATVNAAASSLATDTPVDERISLVFAKGPEAYPIINYEYAIINASQPDATTAKAIQTFLTWALTTGNAEKYVSQVNFLPLPPAVVELSKSQIARIQ